MKLFKNIFFIGLYSIFLFLCLVVTDQVYARYEKFPFQNCLLILQRWKPFAFKTSDIPGLIYEMVPNVKKMGTNSMGIRDKEYQIPKPLNTFRILILGDSVAYGSQLEQEEVFSTLLRDKLNNHENNITYEVINAYVAGYNTMQEYIAFVNKCYIYKPDLVLVGFCHNDITPAFVQEADQHGIIYSYLRHKKSENGQFFENITPYEMLSISMPNIFHLPSFLHRRLMLSSSLYRGMMIRIYDSLTIKNPYKYPPGGYFNIVKDQTEYAIKNLKNYCRDYSIDLIFVLFPHLTDKYPIPEARIYDFIGQAKKILEGNSINYIDLRPYYQSRVDTLSKLRFSLRQDDTTHLNTLVHKLTAAALYDYLVEYLKDKHKW